MQGICAFGTGCRGAHLPVWLIFNDRIQPSFMAGVLQAAEHTPLPAPCSLYDTPHVYSAYSYRGAVCIDISPCKILYSMFEYTVCISHGGLRLQTQATENGYVAAVTTMSASAGAGQGRSWGRAHEY